MGKRHTRQTPAKPIQGKEEMGAMTMNTEF